MDEPNVKSFSRQPCYNPDCYDDPDDFNVHYHAADPTDSDFIVRLPKGK